MRIINVYVKIIGFLGQIKGNLINHSGNTNNSFYICDMLSTKEAAKMLNVETQTVRKYITEGLGGKEKVKLKAIQVKHGAQTQWRIRHIDLQEFKERFLT